MGASVCVCVCVCVCVHVRVSTCPFLFRCTDDFNGAQLKAVCVEAGMIALRRKAEELIHEDYMDGMASVCLSVCLSICLSVISLSVCLSNVYKG